jgi:3-hydroxyisobutyrate dehydrogenase-like beta-hydroxyacid dehydrogenase
MKKVCLIGLGKMGTAIATRMLSLNIPLTVYNRTHSKMQLLVTLGAKSAHTITEAVADVDLVITCLLDDNAMLEFVAGHDGLLSVLPTTATHISTATILPDTAVRLSELHQAHGSRYVSATVLGVPKAALIGKLTAFCAGDPEVVAVYDDMLKTFAESVNYLGTKIKAPQILKICMNYALMTTLELISELNVFAEKSGLDAEVLQKGLHHIYGHPAYKLYIDKIKERNFDDVNFDMKGGMKDVSVFQKAFTDRGIPPRLADLVKSRFISAIAHGMEDKDWSAIYEVVRDESGLS